MHNPFQVNHVRLHCWSTMQCAMGIEWRHLPYQDLTVFIIILQENNSDMATSKHGRFKTNAKPKQCNLKTLQLRMYKFIEKYYKHIRVDEDQCMCLSRAALTIGEYGDIVPIQGRLHKRLNIVKKFTLETFEWHNQCKNKKIYSQGFAWSST